jgi:SAM-dependent methyltransferase
MNDYQRQWWAEPARYRSAEHPISRIYADGKLAFLDQHLQLAPGARVLDVGTGNGTIVPPLARRRYEYVGIDTSPDLLARHIDRTRVAMASVIALPFADRSFDLVICSCLLHHVDDRVGAVAEMARTSRRYVCLIEPNRWNPLQSAFSLLVAAERGGLDFDQGYLVSLLAKAGLRPLARTSWGMTFPNKLPAMMAPVARLLERPLPLGNVCMAIGELDAARQPL